jgi:hypothetical protein
MTIKHSLELGYSEGSYHTLQDPRFLLHLFIARILKLLLASCCRSGDWSRNGSEKLDSREVAPLPYGNIAIYNRCGDVSSTLHTFVQSSAVNSLLGIVVGSLPYDFLSEMEPEVKFFVHITVHSLQYKLLKFRQRAFFLYC